MHRMNISGEVYVSFNVSIILHWTDFSRFIQYLVLCVSVLRKLGEFTCYSLFYAFVYVVAVMRFSFSLSLDVCDCECECSS